MRIKKRIAVAGGCNVDLTATAFTEILAMDSNPGSIQTSVGGVGRNVAENLCRLGFQVSLLTALGGDPYASLIRGKAEAVGLDLSRCLKQPDMHTSCYLCINQPNGDVAMAVSAMEICDRLSPSFFAARLSFLQTCDYVVMDANLPSQSLDYLAEQGFRALCADAVSAKKAVRLNGALPALYFLKANRAEAEALSGIAIQEEADVREAMRALHKRGVRNVAITLSERGAAFSNGHECCILPQMHAHTVNSTGCGDAFFAGALNGLSMERCAMDCLTSGLAMASLCAGAGEAVSPAVSPAALEQTRIQFEGGMHS